MANSLTPREIQARIRSGASVADVAAEAGTDVERIEAFAGPVMAEREHIAAVAQTATVRQRGEAGSHRRLGDLIERRLSSRGLDASEIVWDAWRQGDLKWRVSAKIGEDADARAAEFVFDPKGRFSVADNADARWMIGEEPRDADPQDENTVDFSDELALVRATQEAPGDEVPASDLMHELNEDTSQLDRLYDMLSGVSEDSVRIYTGLDDAPEASPLPKKRPADEDAPTAAPALPAEPDDAVGDAAVDEALPESDGDDSQSDDSQSDDEPTMVREVIGEGDDVTEPTQDALVDDGEAPAEPAPKPKGRRRRAKVPSWDEIMFGGPTK